MRIRGSLMGILWATTLMAPTFAQSAQPETGALPWHVQAAVVKSLESEHVTLSPQPDPKFVRYDSGGRIEVFTCPLANAYEIFSNIHGSVGTITVGSCGKNAHLNASMAKEQAKRFQSALASADPRLPLDKAALLKAMKPETIEDRGTVFVHLNQWFVSGIGGAGEGGAALMDTLLMLPSAGENAVLIQGALSAACSPPKLPFCGDLRATLREVARQTQAALTAKTIPAPPRLLEPLTPGKRTICDSVAWVVKEALEESDAKKIAITETLQYKRHDSQPDIQEGLRRAAREHADGTDIPTAARNAGMECLTKPYRL